MEQNDFDEIAEVPKAAPTENLPVKRPTNVPPKKMNNTHELICYLAALGMSQKEICEKTGYAPSRISVLINTPEFKFVIQQHQWKIFGKDPKKKFDNLVPKAVNTVEAIMLDENVKESTRLSAAREILDRSMGKPTQKVEVQKSLVLDVYEKLDAELALKKNTFDVESRNMTEIEDAKITEEIKSEIEAGIEKEDTPEEVCDPDEIDPEEWIKNNM